MDQRFAKIVLLCDQRGLILKIIRGDFDFDGLTPGQLIRQLVDLSSRIKLLNFMAELFSRGAAYDWEIITFKGGQSITLYLSGKLAGDNLVIMFANTTCIALALDDPLLENSVEQENTRSEPGRAPNPFAAESGGMKGSVLDEITRLNNELVTLQRDLLKKNAELQESNAEIYTLNQELDLRLSERTSQLADANQQMLKKVALLEQNQQELQKRYTEYQIIADNTYDWEQWVDAQGQFIYSSPSCKRITGFTPEAFIQDPGLMERIIHPDDLNIWQAHSFECENHKTSQQVEFRILRADGVIRWISHNCQPIFDELDSYLGRRSSNRDISIRKEVEAQKAAVLEAMHESEEKYRTLFENTHTVMLLIDPETGSIVDANLAAISYYGYSHEEFIKMNISQLNTLSPSEIKDEMERVRAEKKHYYNLSHRLANGEIRPVEIYSGPVNFLGRHLLFSVVHDNTERKKAEDALIISEAKYRLLAENMADVVWILDLSEKFLYLSPSIFHLCGFTPEQMVGRYAREIMTPESYQLIAENLPGRLAAFENGDESVRTRSVLIDLYHKNGSIVPTEVVTTLLTNAQGQVFQILGVTRDITARKQVETALRQSEEQYRNLYEDAIEGIAQTTPDGKYINANQSYVRMFAYDSVEDLYSSVTNVASQIYANPDDRLRLLKLLAATSRVENFEGQALRKNGEKFWISMNVNAIRNQNGELTHIDTRIMDITERKLAEISLQEKTKELDRFFNIALDLLCIADTDGYFRRLNQAWETTLGYSISDLENKLFLDYVHPDDIQCTLDSVAQLSEQKPVVNFVNRYRCKDGAYRWIEWHTAPFGKQIYAAARDITERKQAEEEILNAQAELETRVHERTAQLEAANHELEGFSHSISHDLRTPLRALDGFSGILLADYHDKLDDQGQDYLKRIRKASRHMWQLTEDLLTLAHVTRTEFIPREVDLSALAAEISYDLQLADPHRKVEFVITPQMKASGDPDLLKIVYENLLHNAYKFTSRRERAKIQAGMEQHAAGRVYFVRDNGAGFDMAYAGKLFAPFQRLHTPDEFAGTGIGLVTAQRIISRHGGRIWTEAAVDQGATFYFTLMESGLSPNR